MILLMFHYELTRNHIMFLGFPVVKEVEERTGDYYCYTGIPLKVAKIPNCRHRKPRLKGRLHGRLYRRFCRRFSIGDFIATTNRPCKLPAISVAAIKLQLNRCNFEHARNFVQLRDDKVADKIADKIARVNGP